MPKAEVKEWPKPNCNTLNSMKNYNNNSEPKSIKKFRNLLNYLFKHLQWTPVIINGKQKCNFVLIFPHECPIWCFWKLTLKANGKHKYVYHSSFLDELCSNFGVCWSWRGNICKRISYANDTSIYKTTWWHPVVVNYYSYFQINICNPSITTNIFNLQKARVLPFWILSLP